MDPQVPASFIPKKPLVETRSRGGGTGLILLVATLLFVFALLAAGAVFAYKGILTASIASKSASLTAAEGAFEPSVISDLSRLDSRLTQTQNLLNNHLAPSGIFDFLSSITLSKVQFTSFTYKKQADGSATIALSGVGDTFSTVALQSDQFGATRLLKDVVFSNVAIAQGGTVTFTVTATLDPSLYLYSKQAASTQAVPNQPVLNQPMASSSAATTTGH